VINLDFDESDGKLVAVGSLGIDFKPHSNLVWTAIQSAAVPENS
jgi:hypothetical protein